MTTAAAELAPGSVVQVAPAGRGLFVRVASDGRTGWGECSPLPARSIETLADCRRALTSQDPVAATATLPAARFALDTARHDLEASHAGCSVAELVAELVAAPALEALDTSQVVELGGSASERCWKVKIGLGEFERELAVLIAMRERDPEVRLRLDVNRRWPADRVAEYLERVAVLDLEWVEEPASASQVCAMGPAPVAIALDESCADEPDATRAAIEAKRAAFVILKPALLGGFAPVRAWAAHARRAGAVPIVSHLFDGPISLAACAELARALAREGDPAPGLGRHAGLARYPSLFIPQLAGGVLQSHRPGLGVHP